MKPLILASGSPRRRELLGEAGFIFEVIPSPAEEIHDASIPLAELCEINAAAKARVIADQHPDAVVLGADTLVYIDETPLGKPKSREQAVEMLTQLSGRTHQVCTGMCLIDSTMEMKFHVVTEVVFRDLDESVIHDYMSKVEVMDKAGSYAVQDHGEMIVSELRGDYSNVVGLPIDEVKKRLASFGLQPE